MSDHEVNTATDLVLAARDGDVLRVTINRPEARNALSDDTLEALRQTFRHHAADSTLRLAVLRGSGDKAFAAGGDLKKLMAVQTHAQATNMADTAKAALQAIRDFPVPVIAAINGDALGGGGELAVACDMRVALNTVRVGFIQGRLAISPAWGGSNDLIRIVGPARALRLLSRAELLDMATAESLGLIDCVSEGGETVDDAVNRFIAPMLKMAPQVMRSFKALTHRAKNTDRADADRLETELLADNWVHDDHWAAADKLLKK